MEKWHAYEKIKLKIEIVDYFIGGNQEIKIYLTDKDKNKWLLYFDFVWDFRFAIENAFIDRCALMRQHKDTWIEDSSIYEVENSEYIKYFENQVSGTLPIKNLKHYLIFDVIDTGLEILSSEEPILSRLDTPQAQA